MEVALWWWAGGMGVLLGAAGIVVAWLVFFPLLPRDLGGARNLDAQARRVRIPVADDAIDGWHLAGSRPATVLLLHGFGRNHHRVWRYGEFLHRAGYGVVVVDFRSSRAPASGRRLPTTLGHHELPDADAALSWIEAQPEFAAHALGVLGESLGGAVALMIAARHPRVAAVAVDCAFADAAQAIADSSERWARVPSRPTVALARAFGRALTGFDPGAMSCVEAAARLTDRPIYFVHGVDDRRVSVNHVRTLWAAAGSKDEIWLVEGAGHNEAWRRNRGEYERRLTAFFDRHLVEPAGATAGAATSATPGTAGSDAAAAASG